MTDHIFFQFLQLIVHTIFSGILDTSIGNNKVYNNNVENLTQLYRHYIYYPVSATVSQLYIT